MNGEPLAPKHGYPIRVVVPGIAGCRSVKWLDRISVQTEESDNLYQRYDYKRLPPEATDHDAAKQFWDVTPAMQEMPANSAIASPRSGNTVILPTSGRVTVRGYALPSGDHGPIIRVEVSSDGGDTWMDADIINGGEEAGKWSWSFWEIEVPMERGKDKQFLSRATDRGGNTQTAHPVWNLRGVGYDGYGEARDLDIV